MHDYLIFFICGIVIAAPLFTWAGIQWGRERERDEWERLMSGKSPYQKGGAGR